jgi:hypothetical protein
LKGDGFAGCGKTRSELLEASGHDFSRAANATKQRLGFSPCGMFLANPSRNPAFYRSLFSRAAKR